jgi:LysM repeat protein
MKLKLPNLTKLAAKFRGAPPRRRAYRATASKRVQPAIDDYDDEERPTTRLSSAFIVVLLLHLVAVAGIYAFNSIKAHRRAVEIAAGPVPAAAPAPKPVRSVANSDAAYASSATPAPQVRTQPFLSAPATHPNSTAKITPKPAPANTPANAEQQRKSEFLTATRGIGRTYTIRTGDNPTSIARKLGVSQSELLRLNNIDDPKKLQIGQTLKVPPPKSASKTESSG